MVELINLDPAVLDALVTCDESWIYCYNPETKRQSSQWKHACSTRPKKAWQSKSTHKLLMFPFFWQHWHDLHALGSHWTDSQQGLLCWGFKGVQQEIHREEASTLQIGSVAFPPGQCTSPQTLSLSLTVLPWWPSRQFLTLPIVQTLLPVIFGYSLSSEAVVMRQLRRWKRLWQTSLTRSRKRTSMGPFRCFWNGTTMHCSRRRLLRRELESHVFTINKSAHMKNVWKLI